MNASSAPLGEPPKISALLIYSSVNSNYVGFGALSILANSLLLCLMVSDFKKLFLKWPFVVFLSIGNIFNSLHGFINGSYRFTLLYSGTYYDLFSIMGCFWVGTPSFLVVGHIIPSTTQCCIAIERIVAITAFNWYRTNWTTKKMWYVMIGMLPVTVCCWLFVGWYLAFHTSSKITRACPSVDVFGANFIAALYSFTAVTGTFAPVVTLGAVVAGQIRFSKMSISSDNRSQFKRQFRMARTMFIVALMDFCLVAVPSYLLVLQIGFGMVMPSSLSIAAIVTWSVYSVVNIVICAGFNGEIREKIVSRLKKIIDSLCCGRTFGVSEVTPFNLSNAQSSSHNNQTQSNTAKTCAPVG